VNNNHPVLLTVRVVQMFF